MAGTKHEHKFTSVDYPSDLGRCMDNRPHEFKHMGMIGLPISNSTVEVQIVNRYHCTHCLILVSVEDHRVPKQDIEAMQLSTSGHVH